MLGSIRFCFGLIAAFASFAAAARPHAAGSAITPRAEYRSSCHWAHETATCVPTYAEIFAPGSPSMRTFNAKAYAAALALEQQCGMQSTFAARGPLQQHGGGCRSPCHWSAAHSRCHIDLEDALRITLSCSGSQVDQRAAWM